MLIATNKIQHKTSPVLTKCINSDSVTINAPPARAASTFVDPALLPIQSTASDLPAVFITLKPFCSAKLSRTERYDALNPVNRICARRSGAAFGVGSGAGGRFVEKELVGTFEVFDHSVFEERAWERVALATALKIASVFAPVSQSPNGLPTISVSITEFDWLHPCSLSASLSST